jgi:hypothetical protein
LDLMKTLAAAAALGLAVLAGSATAQTAADRSLDAVFSVHARGIEAGDFTFRFRQIGSSYEASANREMKGWVGAALRASGSGAQARRAG